MSLINVVYEPLYKHFFYAQLGDFKLIIDTHTGYFNVTKFCVSGGKQYKNWLQTKSAKEYIEYLKNHLNEPLMYEYKGGKNESDLLVRGTYVSRFLITHVGCWMSPDFAYKTTEIVTNYFVNEFRGKCERNEIKISELISKDIEEMDCDYNLKESKKKQLFILISINDVYPYYVIRCQKKSKSTQIKKLKNKYPDLTEIFEISYDPDSFNLFKLVKEKMSNITSFCNGIKLLNGYTVEEFENDVRQLAESCCSNP